MIADMPGSRQMSNERIKQELGFRLRYPAVSDGLAYTLRSHCYAEGLIITIDYNRKIMMGFVVSRKFLLLAHYPTFPMA